jgi:riboflavin biosynthesis pyrimidine reductase
VKRLHPDPAELDAEVLLGELELASSPQPDRPSLAINMVASIDGRAAIEGRSAPLTNPFDRLLFHALRGAVDAVLVGSRTLAAERYGPLVRDPERRRRRVARGLAPSPIACVVTRSGELDLDLPLFEDPDSTVVVFTAGKPASVSGPADVHVVSVAPAELEPQTILRRLRADHGVRSVLCEGGPTLNAALLRAGVVDELFLSVAPVIAGGLHPLTIVAGDLTAPARLELRWVLEADSALFLRYGVMTDE